MFRGGVYSKAGREKMLLVSACNVYMYTHIYVHIYMCKYLCIQAEEFARGMIELKRSNIVHCDIKPCNVLMINVPNPKAGKPALPGLKVIE